MNTDRSPYSSVILLCLVVSIPTLGAEEKKERGQLHELHSKRVAGSIDRIEAVLEAEGTLKIGPQATTEKGQSAAVKMTARAGLVYVEKTLGGSKPTAAFHSAVRHYERAEASIQVGEEAFQPSLRDQRRLIGVELRKSKAVLYSPRGPLTREELDLLDVQGNSLLLDRLLPAEAVAVGDAWKHPEDVLAALFGLDAIASTDAQSVLQSVREGSAQMEMAGQVQGSIHGRPTRLQVKAKYRFDMELGRITWFALLVKEDREASPIGPGLDVVARLQMKIAPSAASKELSESALKTVSLGATTELEQLSYASPDGAWRAMVDRRWVLISEKPELTVFRMVDDGKYIAQCSVSALSQDPPKTVALGEFQDEIRQALGKNFRRFVRAGQSVSEAGQLVFRVEVQGEASGVPMDWVYYRIADKSGRGIVVLFTLESSLADRFQESDRDLVRTIRFAEPKSARRESAH